MPNMIYPRVLSWVPEEQIEESAKAQIQNMAKMPFVFDHLAIMPDCHFGLGATVGSCIPTRGAIIPGAVGVDIGCFTGDTKVPLLNGTQKTLRDLTDINQAVWVYSIDLQTNKIVPGKAHALKTRSNAPLVRVIVSGGDEIICTPDHQLMLLDGSYKAASELTVNESLMPFYRKWQTRDGYEDVSNGRGTSQPTHKMVYQHLHGPLPQNYVVHHLNHKPTDNRPENLSLLSQSEHSKHHRLTGPVKFDNNSTEFQEIRIAGIRASNQKPERQEQMAAVGSQNIINYMEENPEHFKESVKDNGTRGAPYLTKFNVTPRACSDCGEVSPNPAALRWHKDKIHQYNHKVISVETLNQKEDVYCLQVDKYHNFALAAGIFVHNCGMIAVRTPFKFSDLPQDLSGIREAIEEKVPLSAGVYNKAISENAETRVNKLSNMADNTGRMSFYTQRDRNWPNQIGSLGSGNHFIEITVDENESVWTFLHSGSRGIGNKVAQFHIKTARKLMERWFIDLPDPDLAYFIQDTQEFKDYLTDLQWCQEFALQNRAEMTDRVLQVLRDQVAPFDELERIECHHNFTKWEKHQNANILVSRKGAIEARDGQMGLIPGSMGTASYVVRGKGNRASFNTAPHGAGRRMGRGQARRTFTMEDFDRDMKGIEVKRSDAFLDELPGAYKPINVVMEQSRDLVDIVHEFHQVINVKGD